MLWIDLDEIATNERAEAEAVIESEVVRCQTPVCLTAREPFISPSLFLDRNFSVGLFLVFIYGMLNFTPIVLFPPMLQNLKGWPDSLIGWMLAMRGAGLVLGFFLAGRMGRLDPRIGLVIGLLLVGWSGVVMMQFDLNATVTGVAWTGVIQGIGCGVMWVPLSVITFATLAPARLPEASAIFHLLRNFGSSIFGLPPLIIAAMELSVTS